MDNVPFLSFMSSIIDACMVRYQAPLANNVLATANHIKEHIMHTQLHKSS